MAGTLVISTLSDGTNSTSSTNCIQGSAKAWAKFVASGTPTINASYNISSITQAASGQYTITFTNAFADANYSVSGGASATGSTQVAMMPFSNNGFNYTAPSTSSFSLLTANNAAVVNPSAVCFSVFR